MFIKSLNQPHDVGYFRPANQNIVEASFAEDFFAQEEEDEVADTDESGAEGVVRILTSKEAAELSKDQMFLCSRDALLTLSHMSIDDICQKCNKPLSFSEKKIGSAVYFKWVCAFSIYSLIVRKLSEDSQYHSSIYSYTILCKTSPIASNHLLHLDLSLMSLGFHL